MTRPLILSFWLAACQAQPGLGDGSCERDATPVVLYADADGDGFGASNATRDACPPLDGYVAAAGDCDDSRFEVQPGALEACDDLDNDCDGTIDEPDAAAARSWYPDRDGDLFGDSAFGLQACDDPSTRTLAYVTAPGDCDDTRAAVSPLGVEICDRDGNDEDCDGLVDDADADVAGTTTWRPDTDGDGQGDASVSATVACVAPSSAWSADGRDCDDTNPTSYAGAVERCDGVDDDCDGDIDESDAIDALGWFVDADGDAFGDEAATEERACERPEGYADAPDDCDDTDADVRPGAIEVCNGVNDDCDANVDEGAADALTWYGDADRDGFGTAASVLAACDDPSTKTSRWVSNAEDCDDRNSGANPDETEVCDAYDVDEDCDGTADSDDDSADLGSWSWWFADADGDGHGDADAAVSACDLPGAAYVEAAGDCDDDAADVHPGATETCNGVDDDCSGAADESLVSFDDGSGPVDASSAWKGTKAKPTKVAASTSGTYTLCDGTYYVHIEIGAGVDLAITSETGDRDSVALSGGGLYTVIGLSTPTASLDLHDVTITEGYAASFGAYAGYGWGGGVYCGYGDLVIDNVVFEDNEATNTGGGFAAALGCEATVSNTVFADNSGGWGGAFGVFYAANATISDTEVYDNTAAGGSGGAAYLEGNSYYGMTTVTLEDTYIHDNSAYYAGGIVVLPYTDVTFTGSAATTSGLHTNLANSSWAGGVLVWGTKASFTADIADFGDDAAETNDPCDVGLVTSSTGTKMATCYDYDDDETFECDKTACE